MVTDTGVRGGIRGLFEGLVPGEVIDAYEELLAHDGSAKDQAEALAGSPGLLRALTDSSMAHIQPHSPAHPAWLWPASPDLALQGVLARLTARCDQARCQAVTTEDIFVADIRAWEGYPVDRT